MLISFIQYYRKLTYCKLRTFYRIPDLKQRVEKINKKIGFDLILFEISKNKTEFFLNSDYEYNKKNGYIKLPFNYKKLKRYSKESLKALFLLFFFTKMYKIETKVNYKHTMFFTTVKEIFKTYNSFKKALLGLNDNLELKFRTAKTKTGVILYVTWEFKIMSIDEYFDNLDPEIEETIHLDEIKQSEVVQESKEKYKEFCSSSPEARKEKLIEILKANPYRISTFESIAVFYMRENNLNNVKELIKSDKIYEFMNLKLLELNELF
jgi:hypothetical protein